VGIAILHRQFGETTLHGSRSKGITLLLATALLWSLGGVLIKWVSWNAMAIAGMRSAIAFPLMLIVIRREHLTFSPVQMWGAFAYAGTVILFVVATRMTTAANAILLQYMAPVYVALFSSMFLGERVTPFDWLIILAAISGVALFFMDHLTAEGMAGNGLAILSGMFFGALVLLMRKQKEAYPLGSVFLGNILTTLVCLPFMFGRMPDASSWIALALLGAIQLGLSYILYSYAIRMVAALEAIMIPVIEPILNPVWVLLVIGERPGPWAIMGGVVVILAVSVFSLGHSRSPGDG